MAIFQGVKGESPVAVSAVGGDDIPAFQMRGKFSRPYGIMVRGVFDDGVV